MKELSEKLQKKIQKKFWGNSRKTFEGISWVAHEGILCWTHAEISAAASEIISGISAADIFVETPNDILGSAFEGIPGGANIKNC